REALRDKRTGCATATGAATAPGAGPAAMVPAPAKPTTSTSGSAAASSAPDRSARQPVTTTREPGRAASARATIVSIDAARAASTNAHGFTTTTSAAVGSSVGSSPSASSVPRILSESTAFFGQPNVSTKNRGADGTGPRLPVRSRPAWVPETTTTTTST